MTKWSYMFMFWCYCEWWSRVYDGSCWLQGQCVSELIDEGSQSKTVVRFVYSLSWICSLYWFGMITSFSQQLDTRDCPFTKLSAKRTAGIAFIQRSIFVIFRRARSSDNFLLGMTHLLFFVCSVQWLSMKKDSESFIHIYCKQMFIVTSIISASLTINTA